MKLSITRLSLSLKKAVNEVLADIHYTASDWKVSLRLVGKCMDSMHSASRNGERGYDE